MHARMAWNDIDDDMQAHLIEWYNVRPEDMRESDRRKLARLYWDGQFDVRHCLFCGGPIRVGAPSDWGDFQGVCQADFGTYPGEDDIFTAKALEHMCDACRRWCPRLNADAYREFLERIQYDRHD